MATYEPTPREQPPPPLPPDDGATEARASVRGEASHLIHLVRELAQEGVDLIRTEVAIGRTEIESKLQQAQRGLMSMATGAAILGAGLLVLCGAACLILAFWMPLWLSTLIVGAAVAIIGFIVAGVGRARVSASELRPDATQEELRKDRQLAKEHMR